MLHAQHRRWFVPLGLGILILIIDQLSKLWILQTLGPVPMIDAIPVFGDWFNIVYHRNTGVAFGLFQNMSPLFTVVALLICTGAIYVYVVYLPNAMLSVQISLGLILGGAIGNVFDRIRLGYVVDFVQIGWWPIFNFADSAITVGAVLLALFLLFLEEEPPATRVVSNPQDDALLGELLLRDAGTLEQESPSQTRR